MRGLLVTGYHKRNSTDIVLFVRTEQGKKKVLVRGFRPYFYVPDSKGEYISIDGERLKLVECRYPEQVPKVREKYKKHYEANIPFVHRFLIDKKIYEGLQLSGDMTHADHVFPCDVNLDYTLCYFDIEVANRGSAITEEYIEKAPDAVICFTIAYDGKYITGVWRGDLKDRYEKIDNNWYVLYRSNEQDLLIDFASIITKIDPDVLLGWNSSTFDVPYLKNRMKQLGVELEWSRFAELDLMRAYASFVLNKPTLKHLSLKEVAVNEGLIPEDEKYGFDITWWNLNLDQLLRYNKRDVWLLVELDKKRNLFNIARMRRLISGVVNFTDTYSPKPMIDSMCLREAKELRVALPTWSLDKKTEKYEGGFVLQPPFGVYHNVAVFDFSRYYPSIMFSFALDPLIYFRYIRERGSFNLKDYLKYAEIYVKRGQAVLLNPLRKAMIMRSKIDAELEKVEPGSKEHERLTSMKQAVKAIINGFYGTCGTDNFRLFSLPIAETVTAIGREGINVVRHYVQKEYGYRVLYSDTDSIFIQVPALNLERLKELAADITDVINDYFYNEYGVETDIRIKFEKFFRAVFFKEVKKRYAFWCTFEDGKECDYIGFKGFEIVRTDASPFIKRLEEEMFEIILKQGPEKLVEWLPKKVVEFRKARLSEIAIPTGLNKKFEEYDSMQAFVRGAIYANTYLAETITPGQKVYWMYVRGIKGKPATDVVSFSSPEKFDELADIITVDYDRMIEFSIENKVKDIFKKFGLPYSLSGRQMTLS
jgi:DNA polymerase elongation subunit (family B)